MKIKALALSLFLACSIVPNVYAEDAVDYSPALVKKAEKGDAQAQYDLGEAYYQGYNVEQDYEKALGWYKKSAEKGNLDSIFSIGYMYDNGEFVEENNPEAMKWYLKAANKGNASSQYNLGSMLEDGEDGVEADPKKSIEDRKSVV